MKVYAVRGACEEFVLASQLEEIGLVDVATGELRLRPRVCPECGGLELDIVDEDIGEARGEVESRGWGCRCGAYWLDPE